MKGIVTVEMVEALMHSISYSVLAKKVKSGRTTFLVRLNAKDGSPDSKLKIPVNISGPLLWSPDFATSLTYKRELGDVFINTKIVSQLDANASLTSGHLRVCFSYIGRYVVVFFFFFFFFFEL